MIQGQAARQPWQCRYENHHSVHFFFFFDTMIVFFTKKNKTKREFSSRPRDFQVREDFKIAINITDKTIQLWTKMDLSLKRAMPVEARQNSTK